MGPWVTSRSSAGIMKALHHAEIWLRWDTSLSLLWLGHVTSKKRIMEVDFKRWTWLYLVRNGVSIQRGNYRRNPLSLCGVRNGKNHWTMTSKHCNQPAVLVMLVVDAEEVKTEGSWVWSQPELHPWGLEIKVKKAYFSHWEPEFGVQHTNVVEYNHCNTSFNGS